MTVHQFIARVEAQGWKAKRQGSGYRCQCPAHGGEDLNLAVDVGTNGGVVVTCHSHGCEAAAVAGAVGLSLTDLMPAKAINGSGMSEEEAVYPYRDEKGRVLYEVVRFRDKNFRQRRRDAQGKPIWGLGETRRVLFGLPELLATKPGELVVICEGEKDALAVAGVGIAATCNPMGAGKWRQEYTEWLKTHLADRRFLVTPDNDAAGLAHADEVYHSLKNAGLFVRVAKLDGVKPKGDVTDWLRAGGTAEQLQVMGLPEAHPFDALVYDGPRLLAAEIPEPEWLVPGLVARRVMTMLVGIGKLGKSVLAHQLCVAAAVAGVWLDQRVPLTRCLYVNWEDPLGLTRARAITQFGETALPPEYHAMEVPWGTPFPAFLEWLLAYLPEHEIGLVVIDPLALAARWKDEKDNSETGPTLRSIQEVAQKTGAAILVVHHTRKMGGEEGLEVRGGSAIFAGIQGFLSFRRLGPGEYQLDTKDKMPGEHGGDKSFLLRREPHTLTWHVSQNLSPQEIEKQTSVEEMIECIRIDPGITRKELSILTGLKESTLRNYLRPLLEDGQLFESERLRRPGDDERHRPPKGLFYNEHRRGF